MLFLLFFHLPHHLDVYIKFSSVEFKTVHSIFILLVAPPNLLWPACSCLLFVVFVLKLLDVHSRLLSHPYSLTFPAPRRLIPTPTKVGVSRIFVLNCSYACFKNGYDYHCCLSNTIKPQAVKNFTRIFASPNFLTMFKAVSICDSMVSRTALCSHYHGPVANIFISPQGTSILVRQSLPMPSAPLTIFLTFWHLGWGEGAGCWPGREPSQS